MYVPDASRTACVNVTLALQFFFIVMVVCCPAQLVGAAFGAAGQRCMALSTAIFVGEAKEWLPEVVQKGKLIAPAASVLMEDDP